MFCLIFGVALALLMFSHNDGEFRGFAVIGAAVGFAAYYFTVGKWVICASEYVVFAIKTLILYAVYYVTLPFLSLARFLGKRIGKLVRRVVDAAREKRIARYHTAERERLLSKAQGGFLEEFKSGAPRDAVF